MALTAWSSFYDHILPELNGVTPALVDFHLRQTAIEFCQETGIHTLEVAPIDVLAGTSSYVLTSTIAGTEPYQIKNAWFNSRPLDYASIDTLDQSSSYWQAITGTEAMAFTQRQPDTIILYPQPNTALTAGLRVEIILCPTQSATGLQDWVASRYMKQIAAGVKGRLMAMSDKPWTRPEFSSMYTAQFEAAKTRATIDANRSFTRGALSARPRPAVTGRRF